VYALHAHVCTHAGRCAHHNYEFKGFSGTKACLPATAN